MAKLDEKLLKQLRKLKVSFLKYYPSRIKNVGPSELLSRQMIWDFKDGLRYEEVAKMVANQLLKQFGSSIGDIVFCCVPASSMVKNEMRYKKFSECVCRMSGAINGYEHVKVNGERLAIHEHHTEKSIQKVQVIEFDKDFFKNKNCLVFDDVITRGVSYATFANQLEEFGAIVLGGFFLGKTTYRY